MLIQSRMSVTAEYCAVQIKAARCRKLCSCLFSLHKENVSTCFNSKPSRLLLKAFKAFKALSKSKPTQSLKNDVGAACTKWRRAALPIASRDVMQSAGSSSHV